jgi:hypothetical protein
LLAELELYSRIFELQKDPSTFIHLNLLTCSLVYCNYLFFYQKPGSETPKEIISYWHPNLTINIIDDHTAWVPGSVPPPLDEC